MLFNEARIFFKAFECNCDILDSLKEIVLSVSLASSLANKLDKDFALEKLMAFYIIFVRGIVRKMVLSYAGALLGEEDLVNIGSEILRLAKKYSVGLGEVELLLNLRSKAKKNGCYDKILINMLSFLNTVVAMFARLFAISSILMGVKF